VAKKAKSGEKKKEMEEETKKKQTFFTGLLFLGWEEQ